MGRTILHIILLSFLVTNICAQQWMDKKYSYVRIPDILYGNATGFSGSTDSLRMDLFLPDCDDSTHQSLRPLLIWIHGGAFLAGDRKDVSIQDMCVQFARRGYVTASIDYRLGFISDDQLWQCNYPNYPCVFASDSAEWVRAYYRAVQDAKGAIRYLINRQSQYRIDPDNVFLAGESAGAFTALGAALLDTLSERPAETFALANAPLPHPDNLNCSYNTGLTFAGTSVQRPDLGDIEGSIEPVSSGYSIKGIGNMYGAMLSDLLAQRKTGSVLPGIYSFHQPCDLVVPIDSGFVYWGLSWCFTYGYGCYAVSNNQISLYGSRTIDTWNSQRGYGYTIQSEFSNTTFPYNFVFGSGSCLDQVNNPCHAYDNRSLREYNLARFFAGLVSTQPVCDTVAAVGIEDNTSTPLLVFPNPADRFITVSLSELSGTMYQAEIFDVRGMLLYRRNLELNTKNFIAVEDLFPGVYILKLSDEHNTTFQQKFIIRR